MDWPSAEYRESWNEAYANGWDGRFHGIRSPRMKVS
ncbi:MAG: hypothetical protein K0R53_3053 [Burkholderiales bacterium]|jgi:hypothetical protein|nr:hypothetical protein [Burkholderiales bacterium]